MGKQAKKKQKTDAQASGQKRHNKATRFMNTKKRGVLWSIRQVAVRDKKGSVVKDDDGNVETREHKIYVPPRTGWDFWDKNKNDADKAVEPYDALHLDWRQEIMEFAADNNARIGTINKADGMFLTRVYKGDNVYQPKELFFEVESSKPFVIERERRKVRK